MPKYLVVIEKSNTNFSVYVPDVPGCVSTGKTVEEAKANIKEALRDHLAELKEDGAPIPEPQAIAEYLELEGIPGSVSDEVRTFVCEHYIEPARRSGERMVVVRAGHVHKALGLRGRMPLVCSALASLKFEDRCGVRLVKTEGPPQGARKQFHFEIVRNFSEPAAGKSLSSLEASLAFFEEHREELLAAYEGKCIAVVDNEVVDSDVDGVALALRVYEKYGYREIYMPKVERTPRIVHIPTPFLRR